LELARLWKHNEGVLNFTVLADVVLNLAEFNSLAMIFLTWELADERKM
jgi:hypothetical protein